LYYSIIGHILGYITQVFGVTNFLDLVNLIGGICLIIINTPPDSLMDSTTSPKVKTMEGKGVEVRSLAHNTLGVEGRVRVPG
jgi:hypothetical protein